MISKKYSLNKADLTKIVKGACIALGGTLATYLLDILTQIDIGIYTPIVVSIFSILLNTFLKWLSRTKY